MSTVQDLNLNLNGLLFHYRDWGGNGQPLLLLHGLSSNARFWDLAAPYLVREFRVLALDQRGHGTSAKTDSGYDFPSVAGDVATFVDSLKLQSPIIIGHSWGGNVGVQVAVDYPGLLAGLVCIDGGFVEITNVSGATWEKIEKMLAPPDFAALRLSWEELQNGMHNRGMDTLWQGKLEPFLQANFDIQEDGTVLPRLRREKHMLIVRAIWDQGISHLLPQIKCPVLLMPARQRTNKNSRGTSWKDKEGQVKQAVTLLPKARLVWMEDSIHDVPVQRPAQVSEVIIQAFREKFFL